MMYKPEEFLNFSNKVNELFPLLSKSNEMANLILVEDLCEDDWIKSNVDKAQNIYSTTYILVKFLSVSVIFTVMSKLSN